MLVNAGRDHRCDEFTPDSLKALALWMTRNAGNEYDDAEESERE